jgi:hypothetical protein
MRSAVWHGLPSVTVEGAGLTAVVLPGRGGRIVSLLDAGGREWLEQPEIPLSPLQDPVFVDGDMCGWDECAPTVDECSVPPWGMPDHGDVWDVDWEVEADGWLAGFGRATPHVLRRRVLATEAGLRIEYVAALTEAADRRMPYLWAAHPQFLAPPGSRVVLPESVVELLDGEDPALSRRPRTPEATAIEAFAPGGAGKLFVDPEVPVGRAELVRADGSALLMEWDVAAAPYLGIWYDRGRHSRHDVVAIEPMTGFYDSCAEAVRRQRVMWLEPGEARHWWVTLDPLPTG